MIRRRQNAFSLIEVLVVIALIGILLVVALWKLAGYVQEAERVSVLTLEGEIRNVLLLEAAKRILNHDGPGLLALQDSNPMRLMLEPPLNYLGELDGDDAALVPGRHWYYNPATHWLVYRRGGDLTGVVGDTRHDHRDIRYEVRVAYTDRDDDGQFVAGNDELLGVRLHRSGGERWLFSRR